MTVQGLDSVVHVPLREGEAVWLLGDLYIFKVNSEETEGRFALWEVMAPVGHAGPPPHYHLEEDETFIVLEGELEVHSNGKIVKATPGSVTHVPKGVMHHFKNTASQPARFLVMVSPGGFERFFKEAGEEATDREMPPVHEGPPDVERLVALAQKYHCIIPPPPAH